MTVPPTNFEALYEEHSPRVLAYCLRRTNVADADDACAETFLIAWRRRDDLPPPPGTLPYLYAMPEGSSPISGVRCAGAPGSMRN